MSEGLGKVLICRPAILRSSPCVSPQEHRQVLGDFLGSSPNATPALGDLCWPLGEQGQKASARDLLCSSTYRAAKPQRQPKPFWNVIPSPQYLGGRNRMAFCRDTSCGGAKPKLRYYRTVNSVTLFPEDLKISSCELCGHSADEWNPSSVLPLPHPQHLPSAPAHTRALASVWTHGTPVSTVLKCMSSLSSLAFLALVPAPSAGI